MSVDINEIKATVKDFVINNFYLGQDDGSLKDSDSFLESGIVDSTGILEVIGFIEDTYEIKVEDSEMLPENLDSLDNISAFILKKKEQ